MAQQRKPTWAKRFALSLLGIACLLFAGLGTSMTLRWKLLHRIISWKFSQTPNITTQQLASWLQRPKAEQPILLDAREASEYHVSHLRNAQLTPPHTTTQSLQAHYKTNDLLVVYCSVGYRSSLMVERMRQAGFQNVYNLRGSIFQWANEGRPVYHKEQVTTQVHPFDRLWGNFLDERYHAKTP